MCIREKQFHYFRGVLFSQNFGRREGPLDSRLHCQLVWRRTVSNIWLAGHSYRGMFWNASRTPPVDCKETVIPEARHYFVILKTGPSLWTCAVMCTSHVQRNYWLRKWMSLSAPKLQVTVRNTGP